MVGLTYLTIHLKTPKCKNFSLIVKITGWLSQYPRVVGNIVLALAVDLSQSCDLMRRLQCVEQMCQFIGSLINFSNWAMVMQLQRDCTCVPVYRFDPRIFSFNFISFNYISLSTWIMEIPWRICANGLILSTSYASLHSYCTITLFFIHNENHLLWCPSMRSVVLSTSLQWAPHALYMREECGSTATVLCNCTLYEYVAFIVFRWPFVDLLFCFKTISTWH